MNDGKGLYLMNIALFVVRDEISDSENCFMFSVYKCATLLASISVGFYRVTMNWVLTEARGKKSDYRNIIFDGVNYR